MNLATECANMSRARRLQVGAVIVKDDNILSFGWNGTPKGWDNNCEDEIWNPHDGDFTLKTKPEVLHAEMNALMKLTRSNASSNESSMFITHAPCIDCAKGIYQAGIKNIYFRDIYRSSDGINFLSKCEVTITKI